MKGINDRTVIFRLTIPLKVGDKKGKWIANIWIAKRHFASLHQNTNHTDEKQR